MKPLNKTLAEFQEQFESGVKPYNVTEEQVAIMLEFDKHLSDSGLTESLLRPGDSFPDFDLPNQNGLQVKLSNLLLRGPVVISFFRGVWCPYCNFELQALQQSLNELEGAGASVIAISPQLPNLNKQSVLDNKLLYDVLADVENTLADKAGITYQLSEELIEKVYKRLGVDLPRFNGDESWRLPVPSRYIVDHDGTIVSVENSLNYRRRTEPSETIAIVKAITRRSIAI